MIFIAFNYVKYKHTILRLFIKFLKKNRNNNSN